MIFLKHVDRFRGFSATPTLLNGELILEGGSVMNLSLELRNSSNFKTELLFFMTSRFASPFRCKRLAHPALTALRCWPRPRHIYLLSSLRVQLTTTTSTSLSIRPTLHCDFYLVDQPVTPRSRWSSILFLGSGGVPPPRRGVTFCVRLSLSLPCKIHL